MNKIKLNFKVGPKEIAEFALEEKNLRKVRSVNLENGQHINGEGFWVWFSPEDAAKYDNDTLGDFGIAVNCNNTFNGIPYGAFFPVKFQGEERPICVIEEMIDFDSPPVFHPKFLEKEENL